MNRDIRVRFAPSPTGHLHIGGLRAALFNYIFAKKNNGYFFLRIEDTDLERSKEEYTKAIIDAFNWVNIKSDSELIYQSKRLDIYKKKIKEMLENGSIYETEEADENGVLGKVIKCKVDKNLKEISFNDEIKGKISFSTDEIDDFIIVRSDGMPLYNLVVVIDDIEMEISHVIRGEEHLSNTPKQILLYNALNAKIPKFAHLPLILGKDGKKLSKRDAATSVIDYKKEGFLPEALLSYLIRLGWSHNDKEIFTLDEMLKLFDLKNVNSSGAMFDMQKLFWTNNFFIKNLKSEEILTKMIDFSIIENNWLQNLELEKKLKFINLYKNRVNSLLELKNLIENVCNNYKKDFINEEEFLILKNKIFLIEDFYKKITEKILNDENLLKNFCKEICIENNIDQSNLFKLLRFAILGESSSPSIYSIINLLGFKETKKRLEYFLNS